jgi:hypothetical protein
MRIELRTFTIYWRRSPAVPVADEPRFEQDVVVIDAEGEITGIFRDKALSRFEADTGLDNVINYYAAKEEDAEDGGEPDPTLN